MKHTLPKTAVTAVVLFSITAPAFAQAMIGGAQGGALGDQIITWVYSSFIHALAAAGLLFLLVGLLFMRSHLMWFAGAAIALLAIGNYESILGLFHL